MLCRIKRHSGTHTDMLSNNSPDYMTKQHCQWFPEKYHFCVQKRYCFIPNGQRLPSNSPMGVDVIIHFYLLRMSLDYNTLQTVPSLSSHYNCNPINHTSPISLTVLGTFVSLLISVNPELKSHVIWSGTRSPSKILSLFKKTETDMSLFKDNWYL
jgi:hypothetical protein